MINSGGCEGYFRPQEHAFNKSTGKYFYGSDARLAKIVYQNGAIVDGMLTCQKCRKFSIAISDNVEVMSLHAQAHRVERFRKHELSCCK